MERQGFHRWAWLVVFLLGGLLMLCGGAQDVTLFFAPELALVPSWHPVPPLVGLVCGLIVLASAELNVVGAGDCDAPRAFRSAGWRAGWLSSAAWR